MTTRKRKHQIAMEKREAFLAELRKDNLLAQHIDREKRKQAKEAKAAKQIEETNDGKDQDVHSGGTN